MYDIALFSDNSGKWCQGISEHYNHHKQKWGSSDVKFK